MEAIVPLFPRRETTSRGLQGVTSYDAAVLLGLLAMVVSWVFLPAFDRTVFNIYFIVVLISAWYGGMRGGFAALVFGLIAPILLLHPPFTDLGFGIKDVMQLALFLSISLFIIMIIATREIALRELRTFSGSLQESEGQLRAITEGVIEALLLVSPEKRIISVNGHFRDLISLPEGHVVGQPLSALQPQFTQVFGESPVFIAHLEKVGAGEGPIVNELSRVWPINRQLELYSTSINSEDDGKWGRLFVFRDVTREREADRAKSQFLSMVSHELRTPLTAIVGFTEMILDGDSGKINEEQTDFLGIISHNADRLLKLVNELLDSSQMESGRIDLTLEPVDVAGLIGDVSKTMQLLIDDKHQVLSLEMADYIPTAMGDHNRLVQVLTNLVSNAHKYSPEGGAITITADNEDGFVRIAVIDNGYGISEADQYPLFTRFYRVNNSMTHDLGGTGLGLNVVKQIVESHGGEITIESVEGEGSTFSFTIPVADVPPDRSKPSLEDNGVIHDSPGQRSIIDEVDTLLSQEDA